MLWECIWHIVFVILQLTDMVDRITKTIQPSLLPHFFANYVVLETKSLAGLCGELTFSLEFT